MKRDKLREWLGAQAEVSKLFRRRSRLEVDAMAWWVLHGIWRRKDYAKEAGPKAFMAMIEVARRSHPLRSRRGGKVDRYIKTDARRTRRRLAVSGSAA